MSQGPRRSHRSIVPATTPEMSDVVAAVLESGEANDAPDADADADVEAAAPETELSAPDAAETEAEPVETVQVTPAAPAAPVLVRRTVSAEIARQLHATGVRFCFTVPGESFLPLLDDLAAVGIRVVTTRHESGAAFMAEALAQSSGRPQVVAVSRAVGASNAAIGIHSASQDSVPLIALVGQVERQHLGREAFQEADIVRSIGSLASWAAQLDEPAQTQALLGQVRRRLTNGRPGPIVLSMPQDVLGTEIEVTDETPGSQPGARGPAADREVVSQDRETPRCIGAGRHRGRGRGRPCAGDEAPRDLVGGPGRARHGRLAAARCLSQRSCQLPRHDRRLVSLHGSGSLGRCRRHRVYRSAPVGAHHVRLRRPAARDELGACRPATTHRPCRSGRPHDRRRSGRVTFPRCRLVGPAGRGARQRDTQST